MAWQLGQHSGRLWRQGLLLRCLRAPATLQVSWLGHATRPAEGYAASRGAATSRAPLQVVCMPRSRGVPAPTLPVPPPPGSDQLVARQDSTDDPRLAELPASSSAQITPAGSRAHRASAGGGRTGTGGARGSSEGGLAGASSGSKLAGAEAAALPDYCSGCGVRLQDRDPDTPGYFRIPKPKKSPLEGAVDAAEDEAASGERTANAAGTSGKDTAAPQQREEDWIPDRGAHERSWSEFNALVDSWVPKSRRQRAATEAEDSGGGQEEESTTLHVLCARCHSLKNYGKVKSTAAEASLPTFDFAARVGRKIALQKFRRPVVLAVVDVADFDGSLPRAALRDILPAIAEAPAAGEDAALGLPDSYRLLVAANKADLLPPEVTMARLQQWVHLRTKQAGLPRPTAVHPVSSATGAGVRDLLDSLQASVGIRGDVWVVGAQNAGKSSLINAMRRAVGRASPRQELTTAALPGTTLGLLRVDGILPASKCRMYDTPGVPHAHQLSSRLDADEVRMLLPKRRLRPRTFRLGEGQTVLIGGVARIDVDSCPGATMYLTVWASDEILCHMGRTDAAEERLAKSAGTVLTPPLGARERVEALGPLVARQVPLEGDSWQRSSLDVAIAGLGWVGVGVKGPADLTVWAHQGVAVTSRPALVPDYARQLEKPGYGSQDVAKAAAKRAASQQQPTGPPQQQQQQQRGGCRRPPGREAGGRGGGRPPGGRGGPRPDASGRS